MVICCTVFRAKAAKSEQALLTLEATQSLYTRKLVIVVDIAIISRDIKGWPTQRLKRTL
jgi:hypothetical protein